MLGGGHSHENAGLQAFAYGLWFSCCPPSIHLSQPFTSHSAVVVLFTCDVSLLQYLRLFHRQLAELQRSTHGGVYQPCSFHASMIFFPSCFACSALRCLSSRSDSKISLERRLFVLSTSTGAVRIATAKESAERRSPALLTTDCTRPTQ